MATPNYSDLYGLDNYSLLSGPQQSMAKTIQQAFANSQAQRDRLMARTPAMMETSAPLLSEFANDAALRRATVTSSLLNQDQQLQNMIDASHATPHGFMQNLAAYLPWLGSAANLAPLLFGRQAGAGLLNNGIVGAVSKWFTGSDGVPYALNSEGKVIGTQDQYGNTIPFYPTQQPSVDQSQFGGMAPTYAPNPANYPGYPDQSINFPANDFGSYSYDYSNLPNFGNDFGGFANMSFG